MVRSERMVVATIETITQEKIILFGAGGMLGHALRDAFPHAIFLDHNDADITDNEGINRIIRRYCPSIVINAAAYTDVDGCEDNRDYALAVNGKAPGIIASVSAECGAMLVHYSSDYVFDGTKMEYREDDHPNPINVYGRSKLSGEIAIRRNCDDYRIIRTSWLFGSHGKNFVDTILNLSKQVPFVRVVDDQRGKPTYTVDLAEKTREIIRCDPGIYHITNDGQCSWYEFARAFIPNAIPCTSAEFPRRAKRPDYSVLANTKTAAMRHWKEAVGEYIHSRGIIS